MGNIIFISLIIFFCLLFIGMSFLFVWYLHKDEPIIKK